MGNEATKQKLLAQSFAKLDSNEDGHATKADMYDWLRNEDFIGNMPERKGTTIHEFGDDLWEELDVNDKGYITLVEWREYWSQRKPEEFQRRCATLIGESAAQREAGIRKVFAAWDLDKDGTVSKEEVMKWLDNEPHFQSGGRKLNAYGKEHIWTKLDSDSDGEVKLKDVLKFFQSWPIGDVRESTAMGVFTDRLMTLARMAKEDGADVKEEIANLQEDREYFANAKNRKRDSKKFKRKDRLKKKKQLGGDKKKGKKKAGKGGKGGSESESESESGSDDEEKAGGGAAPAKGGPAKRQGAAAVSGTGSLMQRAAMSRAKLQLSEAEKFFQAMQLGKEHLSE